MCGIIGAVERSASLWHRQNLENLRHRGPDEQGHRTLGTVQLGHTRLSIIDLSSGSQPMSDVHGVATIVFNGEIYNHAALRGELSDLGHRFATRSDTEVILGAYLHWGVQGFARLRGMYAFALHDHRDGSTILARDPFGIKPLFVSQNGGGLYFASEQAALLELSEDHPELDVTSVLETLLHRHPFGQHTLYEGVKRLEPGTCLVVAPRAETVRSVRFFDLPEEIGRLQAHRSGPASLQDAEEQVRDSVRHHAIADVPVGCFLSGGLDSSIVARTLTSEVPGRLNAYSVGFQNARSEQSELPHARAVAAAVGAELHEVEVAPSDFAELAPRLSGTRNGPFPDPADIAMLKLSLTAARDVKVVLTGEGSDEAFAGYPKYAADRFAPLLRLPMGMADRLLKRKGRLGIAANALGEPRKSKRWLRWFQNDTVPSGMLATLLDQGGAPDRATDWVEERIAAYPRRWSNMQRMQMLDLESWLPNNLLHRGDYTTMQASLEQRVPLLDMRLTPWAVALPDSAKVKGLSGKKILREAFARQLPPAVVQRPKSGFRLPLGEWLSGDPILRAMVHDHLGAPNAAMRAFLPKEEVDAILRPAALGTIGGAKLAWTVLCLELWLGAVSRSAAPSYRRVAGAAG
jgi:asparagine synthase (glutamine-hydrolysing)